MENIMQGTGSAENYYGMGSKIFRLKDTGSGVETKS